MGNRTLLASSSQFHTLNMQTIYIYKFSSLSYCLLLFFNIIVGSHFDMRLMEALVSLLLGMEMTMPFQENKKWRPCANSTIFQMETAQ